MIIRINTRRNEREAVKIQTFLAYKDFSKILPIISELAKKGRKHSCFRNLMRKSGDFRPYNVDGKTASRQITG